jgi:hypothetical protein
LADGTAAVAFLWAPSGRLAGQLPAKVRCKAAAVPKDPRGRVLRNLWGLRLGRATPQGSLPTAFAFLGWACRRDSLRTLSVHFGMPPASTDGDPTAWQAALPTLSNAAVLADSAAPSAFLAPLLQAANVQGWLQTTVIAQWSHRTDRWSPDQAVLLRDALQAAAEQANVAPA